MIVRVRVLVSINLGYGSDVWGIATAVIMLPISNKAFFQSVIVTDLSKKNHRAHLAE
jgi:hypothetical protein